MKAYQAIKFTTARQAESLFAIHKLCGASSTANAESARLRSLSAAFKPRTEACVSRESMHTKSKSKCVCPRLLQMMSRAAAVHFVCTQQRQAEISRSHPLRKFAKGAEVLFQRPASANERLCESAMCRNQMPRLMLVHAACHWRRPLLARSLSDHADGHQGGLRRQQGGKTAAARLGVRVIAQTVSLSSRLELTRKCAKVTCACCRLSCSTTLCHTHTVFSSSKSVKRAC